MAKPGPQKINRYGDTFKLQAVQMSNVPGVLIKDVAESLCIHPFMLSKWRKQVRDGVLTGKPAPIDVAAVGISHVYQLRSNLVHGNLPYPTFETVGAVAGALEVFVSDLLTVPILGAPE